jgi:5-formyltetrahydrofolate cyclo-ligase
MTLEEIKKSARADAILRRKRAHDALAGGGASAADALRRNFLAAVAVPIGAVVSGFWPVKEEIDTRPLLLYLHGLGHVCGFPIIVGRGFPLKFRRWHPERADQGMVAGKWGIPVPAEDCEDVAPDLLLVPLLTFDRKGNRLGYGAGYYDRTLATLRARKDRLTVAVGVGYAAQEVEVVPVDEMDERLDWIVTEKEAIRVTPEIGTAQ